MPMGELLLTRSFRQTRVLQLFTPQLSTTYPQKNGELEKEPHHEKVPELGSSRLHTSPRNVATLHFVSPNLFGKNRLPHRKGGHDYLATLALPCPNAHSRKSPTMVSRGYEAPPGNTASGESLLLVKSSRRRPRARRCRKVAKLPSRLRRFPSWALCERCPLATPCRSSSPLRPRPGCAALDSPP